MSNFDFSDERWYGHTDSDGNKYYDHNAPGNGGGLGCLSGLGVASFFGGGLGVVVTICKLIYPLIYPGRMEDGVVVDLLGALAMLIVGFILFRFGTKHHI